MIISSGLYCPLQNLATNLHPCGRLSVMHTLLPCPRPQTADLSVRQLHNWGAVGCRGCGLDGGMRKCRGHNGAAAANKTGITPNTSRQGASTGQSRKTVSLQSYCLRQPLKLLTRNTYMWLMRALGWRGGAILFLSESRMWRDGGSILSQRRGEEKNGDEANGSIMRQHWLVMNQ